MSNYAIPGIMRLDTPKADDDAIHIVAPSPGLDIAKLAATGVRSPETVLHGDAVWRPVDTGAGDTGAGLAGLSYRFDSTAVTLTDPGAGNFNVNDEPSVATSLVISSLDIDGNSRLAWLTTWNTGGTITIRQIEDPRIFKTYSVQVGSRVDYGAGAWSLFTVVYVGSAGEFGESDACDLSFAAVNHQVGEVLGAIDPVSKELVGVGAVAAFGGNALVRASDDAEYVTTVELNSQLINPGIHENPAIIIDGGLL
jgi:hypothetical protein